MFSRFGAEVAFVAEENVSEFLPQETISSVSSILLQPGHYRLTRRPNSCDHSHHKINS